LFVCYLFSGQDNGVSVGSSVEVMVCTGVCFPDEVAVPVEFQNHLVFDNCDEVTVWHHFGVVPGLSLWIRPSVDLSTVDVNQVGDFGASA